MRKLVQALSLAFLGFSASTAAMAETTKVPEQATLEEVVNISSEMDATDYPVVMNVIIQSGLSIKKKFEAQGGLTGWLISAPDGSNSVVYTPPSGDVIIAGSLVTIEGEDLTATYMEEFVNYDEYFDKLEEVDSIVVGPKDADASSTIYAFLDASCIFCNYLYKALEPYVEKGLEVKWIPVGILGPDSAGQAAAIMEAPDRAAALHEHTYSWNVGGSKGIDTIPLTGDMKNALDANSRLLTDLGGSGTPLVVYKNAEGKWQKVAGMPRLSELPEITGLPEQTITNPDLERFR